MAIKDGLLKFASNFVEAVIPPYICLSITECNLQGWVPLHYDTSISIPTIFRGQRKVCHKNSHGVHQTHSQAAVLHFKWNSYNENI